MTRFGFPPAVLAQNGGLPKWLAMPNTVAGAWPDGPAL